jgi:hypothetical protein
MALDYECEHFTVKYRDEDGILFVIYQGILTPDVTRNFYQWMGGILATRMHDLAGIKGTIFNFQEVTNIDNRNLTTVQRESQHINQQVDASKHPVALVVKTKLQEQLIRIGQKVSPQQSRKRIVFSEKAGREFIDEFLKNLEKTEPQEKV